MLGRAFGRTAWIAWAAAGEPLQRLAVAAVALVAAGVVAVEQGTAASDESQTKKQKFVKWKNEKFLSSSLASSLFGLARKGGTLVLQL